MSGQRIIDGLREAAQHAREYPAWICSVCGDRRGRRIPTCATWHVGDSCGWCGRKTATTEPRDYGYPPAPQPTGGDHGE